MTQIPTRWTFGYYNMGVLTNGIHLTRLVAVLPCSQVILVVILDCNWKSSNRIESPTSLFIGAIRETIFCNRYQVILPQKIEPAYFRGYSLIRTDSTFQMSQQYSRIERSKEGFQSGPHWGSPSSSVGSDCYTSRSRSPNKRFLRNSRNLSLHRI